MNWKRLDFKTKNKEKAQKVKSDLNNLGIKARIVTTHSRLQGMSYVIDCMI